MSANEANSVQRTTASITVEATVEQCYQLGMDIEAYPEWVDGLSAVSVQERDAEGWPSQVRFEAAGLGRRATYTLAYDLSGAPGTIAWNLVEGDLTRMIDGRYVFTPVLSEADGPATQVDYELAVDLAVPLPGFVKRRVEDKIVDAALRRFKAKVEG